MKLLLNSFFLLALGGIAFSTAACHKIKDDNKLTKDQRDSLKNSQYPADADATKIQSDANAKNMANVLKILSQADNIFEQVWPRLWEEGATPVNNVFRVSRLFIKTKFSEDGKFLGLNTGCTGNDIIFKINSQVNTPAGKNVPTGYLMAYEKCQPQQEKRDAAKTANALMSWNLDPSGALTMTFESKNYPEGTGLSLKTLGRPVKCTGQVQLEDARLDRLSCSGLGQNKNAQEYIEFTKLEFIRSAQMLVHVVGQRYRSLSDLDRSIDMMVPLTGEIQITENVVPREKPVLTQVPVPAPEMPTGPIKPPHVQPAVVTTAPEQSPEGVQTDATEPEPTEEEVERLKLGLPLVDEGEPEIQEPVSGDQDTVPAEETPAPEEPKEDPRAPQQQGNKREVDRPDYTPAMNPASLR